jgi:hypothetical protein
MNIIEPMNYETIPIKVEAFIVPDFNEFIDDPIKCKQFLDEVNIFIRTTYEYTAEITTILDKRALHIYCGIDILFAFPGNILVKYESGKVTSFSSISFSKEFRKA